MYLVDVIVTLILNFTVLSSYPIVLFHGFNDSCDSTIGISNYLSHVLNVHVKCIEIGNGNQSSIFKSIPTQGKEDCDEIKNDPIFANKEDSVIGISQGGLMDRDIIQKFSFVWSVYRFVSLSGPQMGVAAVK